MLTGNRRHLIVRALATAAAIVAIAVPSLAKDYETFVRKGASYQDVRLDLEQAVIAEGLKIDYVGDIGAMLSRTGADVGSTKPVYKNAEFMTFCSARLSRAMMEADPANIAQCPYIVFVYETAAKPGEVVVGFRKVETGGKGEKVLKEINKLLEKIARSASR